MPPASALAELAAEPPASWSAFEDISGIDFYEVSIGNNKGSDNASRWQEIGNDTSYIFTGLDLQDGDRYYVNVRATDLIGNVSAVASSNGFVVDLTEPNVSSISIPTATTVPLFEDLNLAAVVIECCPVPQPAIKISGFLVSLIFSKWSFRFTSLTTFEIGAGSNLKPKFTHLG